jgi:hypothetical protein
MYKAPKEQATQLQLDTNHSPPYNAKHIAKACTTHTA